MVWGDANLGGATACFGPIFVSLPPAGCTGWPITGFDWSTAPGTADYSSLSVPIATHVRTANVTLIGHPEPAAFVLDAAPQPAAGPGDKRNCSNLHGKSGDQGDLQQLAAVLVQGQTDAKLWNAGYDTKTGNAEVMASGDDTQPNHPTEIEVLINDTAVQKWIVDHAPGRDIQLCGLLTPQ